MGKVRNLEEMCDDESLCKYCYCTDYGERPTSYSSPNGYYSCEGRGCEDAYEMYLETVNEKEE